MLIINGAVVTPSGVTETDLLIDGGVISASGRGIATEQL